MPGCRLVCRTAPEQLVTVQTTREIVTLERMHRAFDSGLMRYGMMKAIKQAPSEEGAQQQAAAARAALAK